MAPEVINQENKKSDLKPIGKAWVNTKGELNYLSITIDRGTEITLESEDKLVAFPNNKREGKRDADYRIYVDMNTQEDTK